MSIEVQKAPADLAELEAINTYARRPLNQDEIYRFNLVLCDNEIDRDEECFTAEALHALAPLFLGKTGVFDHDARAENQTARIYHCAVVEDSTRKTSYGAPYAALRAKAYLVRCDKNESLMREIDAGIKKEVSVGCSMAEVTCSICGTSQKDGGCGHRAGELYDGVRCYRKLESPTDAYEWSFVAVPAQREAGVTKRHHRDLATLQKAFSNGTAVALTGEETAALEAHWQALSADAEAGKAYRAEVEKRLTTLACLHGEPIPLPLLQSITKRMNLQELLDFSACAETLFVREDRAVRPQLWREDHAQQTEPWEGVSSYKTR